MQILNLTTNSVVFLLIIIIKYYCLSNDNIHEYFYLRHQPLTVYRCLCGILPVILTNKSSNGNRLRGIQGSMLNVLCGKDDLSLLSR